MPKFLFALLVAALLTSPLAAQEAKADLRTSAREALQDGDFARADALSTLLINARPDDADALLIRAAAARGMGRPEDWSEASVTAYRVADTDFQRFDAAMLAAQAAAAREQFMRAQIWLRRADQYAPDAARNAVAQAYRQVAARNPLSVQLSFGFTPSDNVNNGGETTTIEIGGLPFELGDDAQQLGGYEGTLGVSLSYRLSADQTSRTDALFELFGKKVWLDSDAKRDAPGVEGSDFDYGAILVGVRHSRLIWPELGPSSVSASLGQSWSGGQREALWQEVQLQQTARQGEQAAWRYTVSLRNETRNDEPIKDSQALGFSATWTTMHNGGRNLSLGALVRSTWSDSGTVDNLALGLNASHTLPTWGAILPRVTAEAVTRDYRKWATTPGGRRDDTLNLSLEMTFPEFRYYGFSPKATLRARRAWSDVDIYDRRSLSVGLTAVTRF